MPGRNNQEPNRLPRQPAFLLVLAGVLILVQAGACRAEALFHHQLRIELQPDRHGMTAEDRVTVPAGLPGTLTFSLHRDLNPVSSDATLQPAGGLQAGWLQQYTVTLQPGHDSFTLKYGGEIYHPPQQDVREARTFESSPGIIASEGTVLTGDSGWYPDFGAGMLTFSLDVAEPQGWHAVSQGRRIVKDRIETGWEEAHPQDEIYLIAAPFIEHLQNDGGIEELVYLRQDDPALAQDYLSATARYIAMYQKLIGPYPYAKFALVENFWETGYGMPSFTLLGSQVIRLPFIIYTSYPHEILHNWWGNGVFVDYTTGNWSEGLTAYLADHLLQEQKGSGAEYRRSILQKYADFVTASRDFPLVRFTSRHSAQTEAVGYGKALMMFHMLRRQLGDDAFIRALRDFYRDYRFRRASFVDLEQAFSKTSGQDLKPFFAQWTQQTGAPELHLVSASTHRNGAGYELDVKVGQVQAGPVYQVSIPLAVTLKGQETAYPATMEMTGREVELKLQLTAQPLRVDVDPEFDVFRRLDRAEIPPALSQVFGAAHLLIVLPRKATKEAQDQYAAIAQAWQMQPSRETQIKWDDEIDSLPQEGAVWLFGAENRFQAAFRSALEQGGEMDSEGGDWLDREYDPHRHALVLTAHMGQAAVAALTAPAASILPVLARKLPHYSKFSYAAFDGADATNLIKGMWPVTASPLGRAVEQEDGSRVDVARAKPVMRHSLAE